MFLLIRVARTENPTLFFNLHSTMFLLIRAALMIVSAGAMLFTFHNVSINSPVEVDIRFILKEFTFHNVSINSRS